MTCDTSCTSRSQCASGAFCGLGGRCCPDLGADLYIDGSAGVDRACCGTTAAPCLTLTQAMASVRLALDQAGLSRTVTLHASVGASPGHMTPWPATEPYPVQLDHGVVLSAPNVDFIGPYDGGVALAVTDDAYLDGGDGQGPVTLRGAPGQPLLVGLDLLAVENALLPDGGPHRFTDGGPVPVIVVVPSSGIEVDHREVQVADVTAVGSMTGVRVAAGGGLSILDGPLTLGGYHVEDGGGYGGGSYGLLCWAPDGGAMSVTDAAATGAGHLHSISTQDGVEVLNSCTVSLTHGPVFGNAPVGGVCPLILSAGVGLIAYGNVNDQPAPRVALQGVTAQCVSGNALWVINYSHLTLPDAGFAENPLSFTVDGGTFVAVGTGFEDGTPSNGDFISLTHLQIGAEPCTTALKNGTPIDIANGYAFARMEMDDVVMQCAGYTANLYNYDYNLGTPMGDLVMNDVTVKGISNYDAIDLYAGTIEANRFSVTGNSGGMGLLGGTMTVNTGELSCNASFDVHLSTDYVGAPTTLTLNNVIWDHVPPTTCVGCPDAGVDILLDDANELVSVSGAQLSGNACH